MSSNGEESRKYDICKSVFKNLENTTFANPFLTKVIKFYEDQLTWQNTEEGVEEKND